MTPQRPRAFYLNPTALVGLLSLSALVLIVAISPRHLVYDEPFHLEGARALLFSHPSLYQFIRGPETPTGSAAGPIYALLHAACYPLTHLQAPVIRAINLVLLVATIGVLANSLRPFADGRSSSAAVMLLSVPMIWVSAGMALTELPALTFATTSVALVVWASVDDRSTIWRPLAGYLLAGIAMAAAILGRQTYLPSISAFVLIAIFNRRLRLPSIGALLVSCLLTFPVFFIWGGLRPPGVAGIIKAGISIEHGLLAFAYLAIVIAIVAPSFFRYSWRLSSAAAVIFAVLNFLLVHIRFQVAKSVAEHANKILSQDYDLIMGSILMAALAGLLASMLHQVWRLRSDKPFLLAVSQTVLMTGTAAGITHQFSSRYVLAAFPFAMFMLQPFIGTSKWAALRLATGSLIGAASLATYFW